MIGGARVVLWTAIDHRHRPTRPCRHGAAGDELGSAAGLAICQYEGEANFYLFYCDAEWSPVSDSWHETLDGARAQAEYEYAGAAATWV